MKRLAVVAVLAVVLAFSGIAFAFENEPTGFRGIIWGDPPTQDMTLFETPKYGRAEYKRANERLYMGKAELVEIMYAFFREDFYAVFLHFEGRENYELLVTICKQKFGEATNEGHDQFVWLSLQTAVLLNFATLKGRGLLVLADAVRLTECQEAKQRGEAGDAETDW